MEAISEHGEMLRPAERIQICEYRIALHLAGIAYLKVSRIRVHTLHLGPYGIC